MKDSIFGGVDVNAVNPYGYGYLGEAFENDINDFEQDEDSNIGVIPPSCSLATMGLCQLEKGHHAFFIPNAFPGAADELSCMFGMNNSIMVNLENWDPVRLKHQIDIISNHGTSPCRLVFRNISASEDRCADLQDIIEMKEDSGYPVTSVWFVREGEQDIPLNVTQKVLLNCLQLDATTLLDAIAYGWGKKDEEGVEPKLHPSALDSGLIDIENKRLRI
jgi:hypothetical protein